MKAVARIPRMVHRRCLTWLSLTVAELANRSLVRSIGLWLLATVTAIGCCNGVGKCPQKYGNEATSEGAPVDVRTGATLAPPKSTVVAFAGNSKDAILELRYDADDVSQAPPAMKREIIDFLRLDKPGDYELEEGQDAGVGYEVMVNVKASPIKCSHGWVLRSLTLRVGRFHGIMLTFRDDGDRVRRYFYSRPEASVKDLSDGLWELLRPLAKR